MLHLTSTVLVLGMGLFAGGLRFSDQYLDFGDVHLSLYFDVS
jgi:Ca2+/H+ antiporter